MGDPWTYLILRAPYFGIRRFDEIQASLGVARNILAARLKHLTEHNILERVAYSDRPRRYEYRLTDKGRDLYSSILAMMAWGDRWLAGPAGVPLQLTHTVCGERFTPMTACGACRKPIDARSVSYRDGPGAGRARRDTGRRRRRSSNPDAYERGRACSVARTLKILGDRWSFLVLREAFFGHRRFDHMQSELDIARNILADRLNILIEAGIFERRRYQDRPTRHEYRLTERGIDLYGSVLALMRWGDDWEAGDAGPPLLLTHTACGQDFSSKVICSACGGDIVAREVTYEDGPGARPKPQAAAPAALELGK